MVGTRLTGTGKAIATKHWPGKHEARQATKHRPAARVRQLPLKLWQPGTGKASLETLAGQVSPSYKLRPAPVKESPSGQGARWWGQSPYDRAEGG